MESARGLDGAGAGAGVALRHCHDVQRYSAAFAPDRRGTSRSVGAGTCRSTSGRTTLLVQFHDPADDSNRALGRGLMLRGVADRVTARADLE
jgi:hypothetical protein